MPDRATRITDLWNWLPAFRSVGETGTIRGAATQLRIAPSAVSRTVRLLESALGYDVFERSGRKLQLNARGERLLSAVRDAMRGVHDGIGDGVVEDVGEVHLATPDTLAITLVLPTLNRVAVGNPTLRVRLHPVAGDLRKQLLRGQLDLVCTSRAFTHPSLRVTRLADLTLGIYCARTHPLRRRRSLDLTALRTAAFVAPPTAHGAPIEGWPAHLERTVFATVHSLQQGLELCRLGGVLGVFPDRLVDGLYRLPLDILPPMPVYLIRRRSLGGDGVIEVIARGLEQS